ncbi:MAG: flagellar biosynthesis protein FlhB [Planctomycetota bacterium]|jgi:flagellar biosynthetic protein FlhB
MPEQPAEKTEQPTQRKKAKAKEQGQVPQSQELVSVASLTVLVATTALLAPALLQWFTIQMKQGIACENSVFADSRVFIRFINTKIVDLIVVVFPILAALTAGSILAGIAVSGVNFAPASVRLKFNTINPTTGLQRLINTRSLVRLCASIAKLLFISIIVWVYLTDKIDMLATLRWAWSVQILAAIGKIILGLMIRVCIALLVLAVADVIYEKWKYNEELKMTRHEVKQERKQTEGAPEVKGRIRKMQLEMALMRIRAEVPKADVVLVNPTHVAVALRYDGETMEAPIMVAKGADFLAEKIREIARAHGIPIIRRPELARTIYSTVKPGSYIPETLYVAVAEVLALIHRLRHKK